MFLGHRISKNDIEVGQENTRNGEKLSFSEDRKEIRRFLWCCGYYKGFIEIYAKLALPLTAMLKDEAIFEETPKSGPKRLEGVRVMKKKLLATALVMVVPTWDKNFHVFIDTYPGFALVLSLVN